MNKDPNTEICVFMSRAQTMGYVFKSGVAARFMNHRYATENKTEIAELTAECENGSPNFYIDSETFHSTYAKQDPQYELRERIRAEEKEKLQAAYGNPERDMGSTEQGALKGIGNTLSIGGLAALSNSSSVASPASVATKL